MLPLYLSKIADSVHHRDLKKLYLIFRDPPSEPQRHECHVYHLTLIDVLGLSRLLAGVVVVVGLVGKVKGVGDARG